MATFDRQPARVGTTMVESVRRLTRSALDAPERRNYRFISAATTLDVSDDNVFCDGTSPYTVTLPSAGVMTGRLVCLKRWTGASTITVEGSGGQTFDDGDVSLSITSDAPVWLQAVQRPDESLGWMVAVASTPSGATGAPDNATYIVQTPDVGLSAEQALSLLTTGLLKVTTGTGTLSTAVADTDYAAAVHAPRHKSGGADEILLHELGDPAASVEFAQQQALQFVVENRTSDPGSPVSGQLWLRTDL